MPTCLCCARRRLSDPTPPVESARPLKTDLLYIDPARYQPEQLQPALEILTAGGLVAFPTETVYGIGAAAGSEAALERLRELKQRPEQPFTLHIATRGQLEQQPVTLGDLATRLIHRFWPGPLTIVLPTPDGSLGLRMPANLVAADLIARAGPLWAPSANPRGEEPARTGAEVRAYFDGQVEMIIDSGPVPLGEASTVVQVDEDDMLEVLREGAVGQEALDRVLHTFVLMVCTGNTCRSPLAEALMKKALADRLGVTVGELGDAGYIVESAGTSAMRGAPASEHSVTVAREYGCDLTGHRSQPVTVDLLQEADLVLTMSRGHMHSLQMLLPESAEWVMPLAADGRDVADPIGGSLGLYRMTAAQIEQGIEAAIERCKLV